MIARNPRLQSASDGIRYTRAYKLLFSRSDNLSVTKRPPGEPPATITKTNHRCQNQPELVGTCLVNIIQLLNSETILSYLVELVQ